MRNQHETATARRDFLEAMAKSLALAAVVVPGIGATVRLIVLSLGSGDAPALRIALAAPVTELAARGIQHLFIFGVALVFFAVYANVVHRVLRSGWRSGRAASEKQSGSALDAIGISIALGGSLLGLGAFIVVSTTIIDWVTLVILVPGITFNVWFYSRVAKGAVRPRLWNLWPAAVVGVLVSIQIGVQGASMGTLGNYVFHDDSHMSDGIYVELGAADGSLFLWNCHPDVEAQAAWRVPAGSVSSVEFVARSRPTLREPWYRVQPGSLYHSIRNQAFFRHLVPRSGCP